MDGGDLDKTVEWAQAEGWQYLRVDCYTCGTMALLPLFQVLALRPRQKLNLTTSLLRCQTCHAPPGGSRLLKDIPKADDVHELNYKIEGWTDDRSKPLHLHAAAEAVSVAHRAFETVVEKKPRNWITLRQGARLLRSSDEP